MEDSEDCTPCSSFWHPCPRHASCLIRPDWTFNPDQCPKCLEMYTLCSDNDPNTSSSAQKNILKWYTKVRTYRVNSGKISKEDGYNFWPSETIMAKFSSIVPTKEDRPDSRNRDPQFSNQRDRTLSRERSVQPPQPSTNISDISTKIDCLMQQFSNQDKNFQTVNHRLDDIGNSVSDLRNRMNNYENHEPDSEHDNSEQSEGEFSNYTDQDEMYSDNENQDPAENDNSSTIDTPNQNLDANYYAPANAFITSFEGKVVISYNGNIIPVSELNITNLTSVPWTYSLKDTSNISKEIQKLLSDSTSSPVLDTNTTDKFNSIVRDSFPLFDTHIRNLIGISPERSGSGPPKFECSKYSSAKYIDSIEQNSVKENWSKIKVPIITYEAQSKEEISKISDLIYGDKIDPADIQRGYILPSKLGHISKSDSTTDYELRQKVAASFSLVNQISSCVTILKETPKLVANVSQGDISHRITNVAQFLTSAEDTANKILGSNLQDVFQHRMTMRKKVLGSLEPVTLRKDLLESSLLSNSLFPEKEFKDADEMVKSLNVATVVKGAYENHNKPSTSGYKKEETSGNRKRVALDPNLTARKKTKYSHSYVRNNHSKNDQQGLKKGFNNNKGNGKPSGYKSNYANNNSKQIPPRSPKNLHKGKSANQSENNFRTKQNFGRK